MLFLTALLATFGLASAAGHPHHAELKQAYDALEAHRANANFELLSRGPSSNKATMQTQDATLECHLAFQAWNESFTPECKTSLDTLFADNSTAATAQVAAEAYCPTCHETVLSTFRPMLRICSRVEGVWTPQEIKHMRSIFVLLGVSCSANAAGEYCLPRTKAIGELLDDPDTVYNKANLDHVCGSCMQKLFGLYMTLSDDPAVGLHMGMLSTLCMKVEENYCLVKFQGFLAASAEWEKTKTDPDEIPPAELLDGLCNRCTLMYVIRTAWLTEMADGADASTKVDELKAFLGMARHFCSRRKGEYCLSTIKKQENALGGIGAKCEFKGGQCPAACKDAIVDVRAELGCCLGTLFEISDADRKAGDDSPTALEVRSIVRDNCELELPRSCATKRLLVKLVIVGIKKAYFEERLDMWKRRHLNALRVWAGIASEDAVEETTVEAGAEASQGFSRFKLLGMTQDESGAITLSAYVNPGNSEDVDSLAAEFNGGASGLFLGDLLNVPASGRENEDEPASVDEEKSGATAEEAPSDTYSMSPAAALVAPSCVVTLLAIFACLL